MNTIFKYNVNAKYSTKDLKGGYNSNNFSLLNVYLNEKGISVKIKLPNIFKDHHIIAKPKPAIAGDERPLSLALWKTFYNGHDKYKLELNEYFHLYRCQLNFAMFAAISALGIGWQYLNHSNSLVRGVYRFHTYFHVRLILHKLGISLPHDYNDRAYYSVCNEYGVDQAETWMYGDWFYTKDYAVFGHEVKATKKCPPDKLTRWIMTQSKDFPKNGIAVLSWYMSI